MHPFRCPEENQESNGKKEDRTREVGERKCKNCPDTRVFIWISHRLDIVFVSSIPPTSGSNLHVVGCTGNSSLRVQSFGHTELRTRHLRWQIRAKGG
jgi:hypothetical protein